MEARMHLSPTATRNWKELYMAALFEDDSSKIPQRITEAENAVAARAVELFGEGTNEDREQQAMENAMYFLRLLWKIDGRVNTPYEPPVRTLEPAQSLAG